jgi:hypothetical protein
VLFSVKNGVWCRNRTPPTMLDSFAIVVVPAVVNATVRGITYHTNSSLRKNRIGAPAVRTTFLTSSSFSWRQCCDGEGNTPLTVTPCEADSDIARLGSMLIECEVVLSDEVVKLTRPLIDDRDGVVDGDIDAEDVPLRTRSPLVLLSCDQLTLVKPDAEALNSTAVNDNERIGKGVTEVSDTDNADDRDAVPLDSALQLLEPLLLQLPLFVSLDERVLLLVVELVASPLQLLDAVLVLLTALESLSDQLAVVTDQLPLASALKLRDAVLVKLPKFVSLGDSEAEALSP